MVVTLMEGAANVTTCFDGDEFPMDQLVRQDVAMGSRAVLCEGVPDQHWAHREQWLASGWKPGDPIPLDRAFGDESFASELTLFDAWDGHDDGRIKIIFGPHAADFISKELLLKVQEEARTRGASLHL